MKLTMIISLAGIVLFSGCVSPQARRGRVIQGEIGDRFPNFAFQDERGETQDLAHNLGDFTVLAFSECGNDHHGPVSTKLVGLVRPNQEPGYARTVGFDIHWSKDGCPQHSDCHLLEDGVHIFSICDARAQVRDLYGVQSEQEVFVIGPDRRIVYRSRGPDFSGVAAALSSMFHDHAEKVVQTRSPDE